MIWMGRRRAALIVALLATALVGCQGSPNGADAAKGRQQADAALARWADAVAKAGGQSRVVFVGELTGQVGDWEAAVGDNNKPALMAGKVTGNADMPDEVPPPGQVLWQDGTTASVPMISARQAVAAIQSGAAAPCDGCTALRITAAQLATGPVETSRGSATAPVWEFTVAGTAVKVTRVAVADPVTVAPPPWDPNNSPMGVRIDSASGEVGALELTVQFIGAPLPGDQSCGEDYTAVAVESDLAVVVIVTRHPSPTIGGCSLVGAVRTAKVALAAPLAERAVLDVQQGLPVPVVLLP